jgi:RNA polymerase sigma factor (sigma-70 family)
MERSDSDLLEAFARRDDDAAFGQLVVRHAGWIVASSRRRLHDRHLAEDATQAVFMLLASKASVIVNSDRSSIAAWLFHAMHLTCGRLRRSENRRKRRESKGHCGNSAGVPGDELRGMLEDAIAQLPGEDRQAIVRHFYEGEDYQTIGRELGCSEDAVRKRISRALSRVRRWMLHDGLDVVPDDLLDEISSEAEVGAGFLGKVENRGPVGELAKGAMTMMEQAEATDFTVWSAEFVVTDVEANLDFFEKLGFRRHFIDQPDAMGRVPRASLRGGQTARIWLRRADEVEGTRPTPGVTLFFWIEGGADGLTVQRDAIAAQGLKPSAFSDDLTLRNFTVRSPDGYSIGFFTAYR